MRVVEEDWHQSKDGGGDGEDEGGDEDEGDGEGCGEDEGDGEDERGGGDEGATTGGWAMGSEAHCLVVFCLIMIGKL